MYFKCPVCAKRFNLREQWAISSRRAWNCPKCRAGLLKNPDSAWYLGRGVLLICGALTMLGLIVVARHYISLDIPDVIEATLCTLMAAPPILLGLVWCRRGLRLANFTVVEEAAATEGAASSG